MNTRQIPLIVMLVAGAVTSIVTRLMHYELETALWILLAVLVVFYIIGCILKTTIDRFEEENEAEELYEDGEVIEKESDLEDRVEESGEQNATTESATTENQQPK